MLSQLFSSFRALTHFRKPAGVLASIFSEISVFPIILMLYPLGIIEFNPTKLPKGCKRVTLLVHGFLHNSGAWLIIRQQLKKYGKLGPIFTINLGNPFQSIDDYTNRLSQQIEEIRAMTENGQLEVNLVGHSMGGIICSHYAASLAKVSPVQVIKIVTIATPFQGTAIAHVASFCPCAQEMTPNNPFLRKLEIKARTLSANNSLFHISCEVDLVVHRSNTFFLGSQNHREILYFGHFACLLLSPTTVDFIVEGLLKTDKKAIL